MEKGKKGKEVGTKNEKNQKSKKSKNISACKADCVKDIEKAYLFDGVRGTSDVKNAVMWAIKVRLGYWGMISTHVIITITIFEYKYC